MSQTLVPPDEPQQAVTVVPAAAPPPPTTRLYGPEPPRKQSALWRAVKWPLRQIIKGIYLILSAAKRHRAVTMVALLALLAGGVGVYGVYRATHPEVLVTVDGAEKPALPTSVLHALHGYQTYNARELWDSLSPGYRAALLAQGRSETSYESDFLRYQTEHLTFSRFVYTGGYRDPADGTSYYVIQVFEALEGQQASVALYFAVDANGAINFHVVLPSEPPQQTSAGG